MLEKDKPSDFLLHLDMGSCLYAGQVLKGTNIPSGHGIMVYGDHMVEGYFTGEKDEKGHYSTVGESRRLQLKTK